MNKLSNEQVQRTLRRHSESGFTLLQMVIVIAIIAVFSTVALVGVASARAGQRRVNSARLFASYLEKARVDSVRRRADGSADNPLASITVLDANTYSVFMDFEATGVLVGRNVPLESGVSFDDDDVGKVVAFDWRGRTGFDHGFVLANKSVVGDSNYVTPVAVSGFGDVTVNDTVYTPLVDSNSTNFTAPTPVPTPTPLPTPTPVVATPPTTNPPPPPTTDPPPTTNPPPPPTTNPPPPPPTTNPPPPPPPTTDPPPTTNPPPVSNPPTGGSAPCTLTTNPASATIRKNGRTSATVTVSVLNSPTAKTVTALPSNANEIGVSPGSASIASGGGANFAVSSKRNNAGFTYQVTFSAPNCAGASFRVTVTN
jgi:type II secretory pathway pseudopilin PulG